MPLVKTVKEKKGGKKKRTKMLDGLPEPEPKDSRRSWYPKHTIPAKGVLGKVQRSRNNNTHPTGVLSFT